MTNGLLVNYLKQNESDVKFTKSYKLTLKG